MKIANLPFGQRLGPVHHVLHIQNRITVVDGFKVLTQQLATHRDAFEHHLCFHQSERIALNGVGMVSPAQHQLLVQIAQRRRRQGSQSIQPVFQRVQVGKVSQGHAKSVGVGRFKSRALAIQ